jgi:hypothetical protein
MSGNSEFWCGQEWRAPYPFIRATYEALPDDPEGVPTEESTWRPGVEHELEGPYGDTCTYADALGEVVFTVIGVFKPGSYPARVFYLRNWIDPDGKRFGKNNLRVTTAQHFRSLAKGYRHEYEMSDYLHNLEAASTTAEGKGASDE